MDITYTSSVKNNYLLIEAKGHLRTNEDLLAHADLIYLELSKFELKKILIAETEMRFPQGLFLYPDVVDHVDQNLPVDMKLYKIAMLTSKKYEKIGEFWQVLCLNAGLQYAAFTDYQKAEEWLLSE